MSLQYKHIIQRRYTLQGIYFFREKKLLGETVMREKKGMGL